jgi:hypothetical protein
MSNTRKQIAARLGMVAHPGAKAKMALPAKWLSEDRYIDERAKRQDEPDAPRFKQGKYIAFIHYRDRALQVDNKLRQTPPGAMRDELESYLREVERKKKLLASRPGAKAKMAAAPGVPELERLYAKFQESTRLFTPNKYRDAGEQKRMTSGQKKDFAFFENLLKAARSGDGKRAKALLAKTDSLLTTHFVPKELRVWAAQFAAHGAKAKMRRMTQQEQSHLRAWIAQNFRTVDEMMEATDKMEKTFESDSEHWESRSWPEVAKAAGVWSRPGAKAKFAVSDAEAYERGVKMSQMAALIPNFREGVQANPWFQLGYQMGVKHGPKAGGMMSQAKREFPAVAARLNASRPGAKAKMDKSAALAIVGKAIADVPAGAQRDALQKALIDYYDNTQASNRLLKQGNTKDANRFAVEAGRAAQIAVRTWDRMGKPAAELRGFTQNLERAAEFSRPGAKAKMRRMTQQEQSHLRAWIAQNFRTVDEMMEATDKMEKTFESDSEHWESRSWPEVAKAAGVWSRPGAKAKFAVSDAEAYERGVKMSQMAALIPNFREGVQANPWFQLGYQMGVKHGPKAGGMMSQAKREFPAVAARLNASRPGAKAKMDKSAALAIVGKAIADVPAGAQRDALQKALIDYYDNTQASNRLLKQGNTKDANRFAVEAGRAAQIAVRTWDRMGKPAAELRGFTQNLERAAEFSRPGAKATAAKPSDLEREDVKAGLKLMAASDEAVSNKIRTLIAEGKPQDQAVAIALDMKRRGEL